MKNKTGKFFLPRVWGERALLLILAFLAFLFFSNDFGLIDIQKTAIILAAGVDKAEDGKFSVTAAIAVPQASKSGGQTSEVSVSGKGDTVAEAFREINIKTGWFPKLVFCDLIVLGESVVEEDVFNCLGYFIRNEYMSDNCLLATCEGKAEEILTTKISTDEMTALGLQKILTTEAKKAGNISTINLKDFSVGYYAEHKSGYMPYIRKVKQPQGEEGGESGGENGGENGGGSSAFAPDVKKVLPAAGSGDSSSGGASSGSETFNAARTALFYEGKLVGILDEDESLAFNLAYNSIRLATLQVSVDDAVYALSLKDVKGGIKLKMDGGMPALNVSLEATAQTADYSESGENTIGDLARYRKVKESVLREAEKSLKENLLSAFEKARDGKCDLFEVADKLQKYQPRYHNAYRDVILDRVSPSFSVKIKEVS